MNQEQNNINYDNLNNQNNNINTMQEGINNSQISYDQLNQSDQPINNMIDNNFNASQLDTKLIPMNNHNNKKVIFIGVVVGVLLFLLLLYLVIGNNNVDSNNGNIDKNINLNYDEKGAFLLRIEDIFVISGRGTIVTGTIERGTIKLNDEVQIIGMDRELINTKVIGIEKFRESIDEAKIGDNVGLLLENVKRDEIEAGQVIALPNSINSTKKFDADIYVYSKEEGGRSTPFFDEYHPDFNFKTVDISGLIKIPKNMEMVMPGDNVSISVTLDTSLAIDKGTKFSIREGGRTIGEGIIKKVY